MLFLPSLVVFEIEEALLLVSSQVCTLEPPLPVEEHGESLVLLAVFAGAVDVLLQFVREVVGELP